MKYKGKKTITKEDLVLRAYTKLYESDLYLTIDQVYDIFDCFIDAIVEAMIRGSVVEIRGFGRFYPFAFAMRRQPPHTMCAGGNNTREVGSLVYMYSSRLFRPSRMLLDRMNGVTHDFYKTYFSDNPS